MRILVVTQLFWPEVADYKNRKLASKLIKKGHEVTVLTCFPNYPLGRIYDGYKQKLRQWEFIDGIKVLRVPIYPDHSSSIIKRVLHYTSFFLTCLIIGMTSVDKPDVIFVDASPMTVGLTTGIYKLFGIPVFMDIVDLWPEAITSSDMASSSIVNRCANIIAKISYSIASKIGVPTEGFKAILLDRGLKEDKVSVLPIWADKNVFVKQDRDIEFGNRYNLFGKKCIIHAGNIGYFQAIEHVLYTAKLLRDHEDIHFVFVGGGRDQELMKGKCRTLGLNNVTFTGVYSKDKIPGILAWADALLVSLRAHPYLSLNYPSKLSAYMAAGRPIIAFAEGEAQRLVDENELGFSCCPGRPKELARTIINLFKLSDSELEAMGLRAKKLLKQKYDEDIILDQYIFEIENLVGIN